LGVCGIVAVLARRSERPAPVIGQVLADLSEAVALVAWRECVKVV
jgi:hypothetical protein